MSSQAVTPKQRYQRDLEQPDFSYDEAQAYAVDQLQQLYDELVLWQQSQSRPFWQRWFSPAVPMPKGLYFWGGVGRGKTYLVDTFFDTLPFEKKWRVHFHRFMHRVHNELKTLKNQSDPLVTIADRIATDAKIICFDEFFVQDITDAMLLGKLFEYLFERGVVLVATSNIVPDELYKNGLQRDRFLPAIKLLKQNCRVINVDSGVDYRLRTLTQAQLFHSPNDEQAERKLNDYFAQLTPEKQNANQQASIDILGREIPVKAESDDVVFFDFGAICKSARSQNDYMEISRLYHAVIISDVEQMGRGTDDIARRFIALVDEFYERKVKLIMSAVVPIEQLYTEGQLSFEFKRCYSRLQEMQSHEYLSTEHIA